MFNYVSAERQKKDLDVVHRIMQYKIEGKSLDAPLKHTWKVITSKTFHLNTGYMLPKQTSGVDCGIFIFMYFIHLTTGGTFDFAVEDMKNVRKWCKDLILNRSASSETVLYCHWMVETMKTRRVGSLSILPNGDITVSSTIENIDPVDEGNFTCS